MATQEITFLHNQLEERKQRLQAALSLAPQNASLGGLLHQVDSALERIADGSFGICQECHETIEADRLLADPLICYCLDHLSSSQRVALERDLALAARVQRNLLPQADLRAGGWESCYHYAPHGPVSGDYCDLIPSDGGLFFVLGDVSGKGVAASMLMTQLHALFRSLTRLSLSLDQIVIQANRVFCESALAGHYATLVCGQAKASGEVEIYNAGHWPAIVLQRGGALRIESAGLPLGMFCEVSVTETRFQMEPGDLLFLYTDGFSEARRADEEYGVERIANLLCAHDRCQPKDIIAACLHDLNSFADGPAFDDVTLLAMQRTDFSGK
jgi:sigma-B regulation protein RsbU (phosphoserine phosphatase)